MPDHDIIVIGASAGGVEALRELARNLPPSLPAAVFVVLHTSPVLTAGTTDIKRELKSAEVDVPAIAKEKRPGAPSVFSCPDCHGVLWEDHEGELLRYRCQVGHAYSIDSMLVEKNAELENTLWAAMRALEERAVLARKLAQQARRRQRALVAERYEKRAEDAEQQATLIRRILMSSEKFKEA